ncbi:chorismate-binding protein, partial [Jatrophihabitans sp.]|uniref:chorismate-binding protein n=1 Tax=Jatrophihabitans sp. TaxID=1932789 RepID=UPI002BCA21E6|nr:chorismate-binding protein [Jatrophihabitans sp.]
MAELLARRLRLRMAPAELLRALAGSTELDTGVLVCLAGRWAGGSALIGWHPVRQVTDVRLIGEPAAPSGDPAGDAMGGGWFGWWGYSGLSWFGYFDRLLRRDPDGHWWLESTAGDGPDQLAELAGTVERLGSLPPPPAQPPRISGLAGTVRHRHLAAVERAITAIRAGQLYQVNVCARFSARLAGPPVELFAAGLRKWAPDYAAFLRTPERTVVSFSPELFLHRDGEQVRTAPIKGTRRRLGGTGNTGDQAGADRLADSLAASDLASSVKDRAENVMIVDLVRNDLGAVAVTGSVEVPALNAVEQHPGLVHLVSTVQARLRPDAGWPALLAATFPPGSVTGAPKSSALTAIADLEHTPRGPYCGAVGWVDADRRRATLAVGIRTFWSE